MANDNQNQVLDENTDVLDGDKTAAKRPRKSKPKAAEGGTTASLFGIELGLRRLEARPTATQCIDCKTLAEIKEKQNNG